jgi:heme/copper-type cytochrome/quinol oxidase subunit 3
MPARPGLGVLALSIFLVSLGVLFIAGVIGFLMIRSRAPQWPPPGVPPFSETGLAASTIVLLLSSATLHWALSGVRRADQVALRRGLQGTLGLGLLFLALQAYNWQPVLVANYPAGLGSYRLNWVLAAVHGAHVLGGIGQLIYVLRRAQRGLYSRTFHPGVTYAAMYWHFLDAVWLALFGVLILAR